MDFHHAGRKDQSLKARVVAQNEAQIYALFPKSRLFEDQAGSYLTYSHARSYRK